MADPVAYNVGFSFSGYQATNPDLPLPGQRVDTELQNIEAALDGTQTALSDIRRSDGALVNGIVTVESLAPGMTTGILPPTNWVTAHQYNPLDSVWSANGLYQCVTAHVSGVFATDLAAGKWHLVVDFAVPLNAAQASANAAAASATAAQNSATAASGSASAAQGSANAAAASAATALTQANRAQAEADRAQGISDTINASFAPLASPVFTGNPTAPTPAANDNDTSIATTAFVTGAITTLKGGATAAMDTLGEIETAVNLKAPLASPALTGAPTAPTAAPGTNTTQLASTAFVAAAVAPLSPIASPLFTGDPRAPTPATADNDTSIATTAFVKAQGYIAPDAASDGQYYSRRNGVWAVTPGGLVDAPNDANFYGRSGGAWAIGYTKAAVDAADALKVAKAGDTMTGALTYNDGTINHRIALPSAGVVYTGTFSNHPVMQQINNQSVAQWQTYGTVFQGSGRGVGFGGPAMSIMGRAGFIGFNSAVDGSGTDVMALTPAGVLSFAGAGGVSVPSNGTMQIGGHSVVSRVIQTVYTSNFTYAKATNNPVAIEVTVIGSGGGSPSVVSTAASQSAASGGGAGAGTAVKFFDAAAVAALPASVICTVAAAATNSASGGTSTFGSTTPVSATGGNVGAASVASGGTGAGTGIASAGVGSGGDLNLSGEIGGMGQRATLGVPQWGMGGDGGGAALGGTRTPGILTGTTVVGTAGKFPGGGGSGAGLGQSQASAIGYGSGGGCIIVKEFCTG